MLLIADNHTYKQKIVRNSMFKSIGLGAFVVLMGCGSEEASLLKTKDHRSIRVATYNVEYKNFDHRVYSLAEDISQSNADLVGTQENMSPGKLAQATGMSFARLGNRGDNSILYRQSRLYPVSSGTEMIANDYIAPNVRRSIAYGVFQFQNRQIFVANIHLPHRKGAASDPATHSRIAHQLLDLRNRKGAKNFPSIVLCDCNSFASNGSVKFETVLHNNGFKIAQRGHIYGGIDKVFFTPAHFSRHGGDVRKKHISDHDIVYADLKLL